MTLNANSLICRQFYACCDQMAGARIMLFYHKVALYLSYLHVKFYDKINRGSLDLELKVGCGGFRLCGTIS